MGTSQVWYEAGIALTAYGGTVHTLGGCLVAQDSPLVIYFNHYGLLVKQGKLYTLTYRPYTLVV